MAIRMKGNNFNQRLVVHLPNDFCRTIIGSGGNGGYHAGNEPKVIVRSTIRINKLENQNYDVKSKTSN